MSSKRQKPLVIIRVIFSPSSDAGDRLRKVMALLLWSPESNKPKPAEDAMQSKPDGGE